MDIALTYLLEDLLLPPASLLLLAFAALACRRRWPRLAGAVLFLCLSLLTALAMPKVASLLCEPLESTALPFNPAISSGAEAIVVLGRGRYLRAPEYGGDTVPAFALERLRYAARLARATGLPLAVAGGAPLEDGAAEGDLMRRILEREFRVAVRWIERESRNTAENALLLRRQLPVDRIVLVTHALHMPRARAMFERAGFIVTPAPLGFVTRPGLDQPPTAFDFVPDASALTVSRIALHEYLGLLWYRWRYRGLVSANRGGDAATGRR